MDEHDITSSPLSSLPTSPSESVFDDDGQDESVPPPTTTENGLTLLEQLLKLEEEKKQGPEGRKMRSQTRSRAASEGDNDLRETKRRKVAEVPKPQTKVTIHVTPTPAKKPVTSTTRKSAKDKKWESPFVYTDEKSPLANADLRAILLLPQAWDILTEDEKKEILALFPDETHIQDAGTANAHPNTESLRNDDDFRHDCARYTENIELGKHDEDWLYQAWVAHEKHKRGDFDSFLRKSFEDEWGVKLPNEDGDQASSSGDSEETKSPSSSPSSGKNAGKDATEEAGNAATKDATSVSKTVSDPLTPTSKLPTESQSPIPEVTKAKVVPEDSPTGTTEGATTVPEVAANGT